MISIKFDFNNKEYLLFFKQIEQKVEIGVITLNKEKLVNITELEKEKVLKNIVDLDYETLEKIENKVNPKALVEIVKFMNESRYCYCDTEIRKKLLEQNFKKYNYETEVVWKIEI